MQSNWLSISTNSFFYIILLNVCLYTLLVSINTFFRKGITSFFVFVHFYCSLSLSVFQIFYLLFRKKSNPVLSSWFFCPPPYSLLGLTQDRSIAVWDMSSQTEITLRRVLVGHRAAVNVVDFDEKYIVSASGDRTIKVWNTSSCEFVRTLNGHKRGIACLQYRDRLVVSGSSDNTIRWEFHCLSLVLLEGFAVLKNLLY